MTEFLISYQARADMIGIYEYSRKHFSENQAERYLSGLDRRFHELVSGRASFRSVDNVYAGVLRSLYKQHAIYFRHEGDVFRIIRILHQRMDPGRHLENN